jgi:MarR family transcriptional regulator, organic hydroperoxide resistance regulator
MTGQSRREEQNAEILECVSELIGRVIAHGAQLAQNLGIPAPFIKALHSMDCPMAMKELGKRMHCDPSFVTLLADMLEKRGLARREPHPADRRVKNIVLTDDGLSLKHRLETEIAGRMPWRNLSDDERSQFLALIRKMLSGDALPDVDTGSEAAQAKASLSAAVLAAAGMDPLGGLEDALATSGPSSPRGARRAPAEEVSSAVSEAPTRS